jgi:hypothetical protein
MERRELGCDGDGEREREGREESSVLDCAELSGPTSQVQSRPVQSSLPDQGGPTSPLVEMVNYK